MLKLEKVNKYFNRHKKNEIHVINDVTLEVESKGLIALLGPSGCGKTTLLNAIGGLDKIKSGKIYIDGKLISTKSMRKRDKIRVLNIGYIFQNYNLLDNHTVYENVAISLDMIGIKNKDEIKSRVNYVLDKVGMYRYRHRLAGSLSGGERQRVGIARALVKNPKIIIADEPTGNLDSKNTLEIMNIIKSISKDKLVILVTHESNLATFYASRIIEVEDGKVVSDKVNEHENELDYRVDNKLYLKDFKEKDTLNKDGHNLEIYRDDAEKLDFKIVIKNGNIYIKSNTPKKIEVVDENSSIEFLDEHYKKISKEDYEKYDFDLTLLDNSKKKLRYSNVYNSYTMLKIGFKKLFDYSFMKKVLLLGFFVSAMFIVYAVSNIFGVTKIDESKFVTLNKNYITVENNGNDLDKFLKLEANPDIGYILPGDSLINFDVSNKVIYQFQYVSSSITASLSSLDLINAGDIIHGSYPVNKDEIVLDVMSIDNANLLSNDLDMIGLKNYEDFIGRSVNVGSSIEFKIVGIIDSGSPSVYTDESNFTKILAASENGGYEDDDFDTSRDIRNYEQHKDRITIKKGRAPLNDYEVLVSIENEYDMPMNKTIETKVGKEKLKVVGYYTSKYGESGYYVSENTIKYENISKLKGMTIYSEDKSSMVEYLQDNGLNAIDSYEHSKSEYIEGAKNMITESLVIAGILLAISFIEIFLMIRASFLSRIKEVGIYRAIGAKKSDIYKMFLGEILVITTVAGIPGYTLMALVLNEFSKIKYLSGYFLIDIKVLVISLALIYSLNIIVGLMPIRKTIKKTPAEILSRNDVD